jgi:hypothetical protein
MTMSTLSNHMLVHVTQHACLCGTEEPHPESPGRIQRILAHLDEAGLLAKYASHFCVLIRIDVFMIRFRIRI